MNKKLRWLLHTTLFVILLIFTSCTVDKRGEDESFSGDYDPEDLISISQGEGFPDLSFPRNQLIIQAHSNTSREEILDLLSRLRIKMIGQIPALGIYQVRVNASDRSELDKIMQQLLSYEQISHACYNLLCSKAGDVGECPVMPDVRLPPDVTDAELRPYNQTQYFTALEIIQGLRDEISMDRVTIGLLEDGYNSSNGEFDDITIENVSERNADGSRVQFDESDNHGSAVTGLICADNDGNLVNGIASTLLGDKLKVIMARPRNNSFLAILTAIFNLAMASNIVNTGYILGPFNDPALIPEYWIPFRNSMSNFPWVLFVIPAPNIDIQAADINALPPGDVTLYNTITVTSWSENDPSRRAINAGSGEGVDMSAPGINISLLNDMGGAEFMSGTCFAAAQVTSAAALVKSVGGSDLRSREIKQCLLEASESVPTGPGGGIQLNYANPLVDLLWKQYNGHSWAQHAMDWDSDGLHDTPEQIEMKLCEEANMMVDEFGIFYPELATGCAPGVPFFMSTDGRNWSIDIAGYNAHADLAEFHFQTSEPHTFELNRSFPIGGVDSPLWLQVIIIMDPDYDCLSDTSASDGFYFNSISISGNFTFTRCSVLERTSSGEPRYLLMDIHFDAILFGILDEWLGGIHTTSEITTGAEGWLTSVTVHPITPLGTFEEAIDEICSE
jgi:hypothetical protein